MDTKEIRTLCLKHVYGAALTEADARRYFDAYYAAIGEIGAAPRTSTRSRSAS